MAEEYYQSAYTGEQIDNAIGRIVNGEIDQLASSASASATEAANSERSAASNAAASAVSADNAKTSEQNAKQSEENAKLSEEAATNAASTAINAAEQAAIDAADEAVLKVAEKMEDYISDAEAAQTAAEKAKEAAANSESNAAKSETNAKNSETNAANSASSASTSAGNASSSATAAAGYASSASVSAANASTAKTGAENAQTAAKNSATAAATSASNAAASEFAAKDAQTAAEKARDEASEIVGGNFASKTEAQGYANTAESNANDYTDKGISAHNTSPTSHNDIRALVSNLTTRINALANSDDTTLDQLAEIVAYIKDNRGLIEQITTGKVSVNDIIDNLTTNVSNKPLSAAQGVVLKSLIDSAVSASKNASNITSGTLPVARGGTGATTAADARTSLGITPENIGAVPLIDGAYIRLGADGDPYVTVSSNEVFVRDGYSNAAIGSYGLSVGDGSGNVFMGIDDWYGENVLQDVGHMFFCDEDGNDIRLRGIADPAEGRDAANKQYVDSRVKTIYVTVDSVWDSNDNGAYYTKTISVPDILSSDNPQVDINGNGASIDDVELYEEAFGMVKRIQTNSGYLMLWARTKPTIAFPIQLKVVR